VTGGSPAVERPARRSEVRRSRLLDAPAAEFAEACYDRATPESVAATWSSTAVARPYVDCRAQRIHAGANEIIKELIARAL
jgi:alkylation response protein AidB-like acyl-CoA dehydrogenase